MTSPKEWRDEQGRYFRAEDGAFTLNSDLGYGTITQEDASFLLRVLPEALGLDRMGHEWGGPMGCCHRCGVLPDQPLGKQPCGEAGLDRAIVEAAERLADIYRNDGVFGNAEILDAVRSVFRAVEAKREAGK